MKKHYLFFVVLSVATSVIFSTQLIAHPLVSLIDDINAARRERYSLYWKKIESKEPSNIAPGPGIEDGEEWSKRVNGIRLILTDLTYRITAISIIECLPQNWYIDLDEKWVEILRKNLWDAYGKLTNSEKVAQSLLHSRNKMNVLAFKTILRRYYDDIQKTEGATIRGPLSPLKEPSLVELLSAFIHYKSDSLKGYYSERLSCYKRTFEYAQHFIAASLCKMFISILPELKGSDLKVLFHKEYELLSKEQKSVLDSSR